MFRKLPPGPARPVGNFVQFASRPLQFIESLARDYGSMCTFVLLRQRIFLLNDPDLVRELLVVKHRSFVKDRGIQVAKRLLGEGLLSSEGDFHKRQRRLSQPAFHRERIASYGAEMVRRSGLMRDAWTDGAVVDATKEMNRLTLGIAGQTLFGVDIDRDAADVGKALTEALESFTLFRLSFAEWLEKLPLPSNRRWQEARDRLDRIVYGMIEERRRSGKDTGDLLSMLLLATDSEGDGGGMSDLQLRDEAMTILLAGHETTANALSWTWYLLAQNPEVEAKLHAELDAQLRGRDATADDVKRLPYTEHVFAESMRLFPPAWGMGRIAAEDVEIGGYTVKKGESVLVSQWLLHHDARFYENPAKFDPDRWEPARAAERPKFSYFPFGAGPRACIGEGFAWMEGVLLLATLAQRWRLRLVPGQKVKPVPRITLRPSPGILMRLERRDAARLGAVA